MYFVDNSTGVSVMPTPDAIYSTAPLWFTRGDSNNSPTYPGPDWMNAIQGELLGVLSAANITPLKTDNTQLAQAIASLISAAVGQISNVPDIGQLFFTTDLTDPNVKYAGTTWEYLGEGLTLRTAKKDGSDLNTTTGADTSTLTAENMPAHTHGITGNTGSSSAVSETSSSFDYGSKSTNSTGDHTHTFTDWSDGTGITGDFDGDGAHGTGTTSSAGAHTHTTAIGAHTHTTTIPAHSHTLPVATDSAGSGTAVSILQKSIMVAIWVRTA